MKLLFCTIVLISIPVYSADIMVQNKRERLKEERAAHKRTALTRFKILNVPPELAGLKSKIDEISSHQQQLKISAEKIDPVHAQTKTTPRE